MKEHVGMCEMSDGASVFVYRWLPEETMPVKAIVQIAHGMAETAARYERLGRFLSGNGYAVYAHDHAGHGQTAGAPERTGIFAGNAFDQMAAHMAELGGRLREAHPGVPLFLLGHSMGSFLTQRCMYAYPDIAQGVILSGTNGPQGPLLKLGAALAAAEARVRGERRRSALLNNLSFGAYNKAFRPSRTAFDWLSRDEAEVDAYMDDPYCGAVFTAGFFRDFFRGLQDIHLWSNMRRIPRELPVYMFSGEQDPVGGMGKGVRRLADIYRKLGLRHVEVKLYPGGRHEMLNERNREEVMRDVLDWLEKQVNNG